MGEASESAIDVKTRLDWDFICETGKVITAFGVKPVAQVQWLRDNFWLSGVVEPLSGWHFTPESAYLDIENFQQLIDALSIQLGEDIAVLQLDQAFCAYDFSTPVGRELDADCSTRSQS